MAYPTFYPFKTHNYTATSTTSNSVINPVAVRARSYLVDVLFVSNSFQSQTAAGQIDITVNGSTASGMGGLSVTTSTGNSSTDLGQPTAVTYLSKGDVLATVCSSCVGGTTTYVVREY